MMREYSRNEKGLRFLVDDERNCELWFGDKLLETGSGLAFMDYIDRRYGYLLDRVKEAEWKA